MRKKQKKLEKRIQEMEEGATPEGGEEEDDEETTETTEDTASLATLPASATLQDISIHSLIGEELSVNTCIFSLKMSLRRFVLWFICLFLYNC